MTEGPSLMTSVLAGDGDRMRQLRKQIKVIAPHMRTALIVTAPGLDDERPAEEIFRSGPTRDGRLVPVSAEALNATVDRDGAPGLDRILSDANDGALLIRDAGGLSRSTQAVLLERLRTSSGRREFPRILASTSHPLQAGTTAGTLLPELLHRLASMVFEIPTLAERGDDLRELIASGLAMFAREYGCPAPRLTEAGLLRMLDYSWPGNLLELENVLRVLILEDEEEISLEQISRLLIRFTPVLAPPPPPAAAGNPLPLQQVINQHLREVLQLSGGNKLRAAEILGVSRSTLYRMLDGLAEESTSSSES